MGYLQARSDAQLLDASKIDMPPVRQQRATFNKAPKAMTQGAEQLPLDQYKGPAETMPSDAPLGTPCSLRHCPSAIDQHLSIHASHRPTSPGGRLR
jgi:hypothetical protein